MKQGPLLPGAALLDLAPTISSSSRDRSYSSFFRHIKKHDQLYPRPSGCVAGRVQGAVRGGEYTTCIRCTTAVLSPRVGARKRAEGSHPQWNFRTRC